MAHLQVARWITRSGEIIESHSPVDGKLIARIRGIG